MSSSMRSTFIIGGVLVLVASVAYVRSRGETTVREHGSPATEGPVETTTRASGAVAGPVGEEQPLPRFVDLGAGACAACKKMAPIVEELAEELAGKATIEFIDVWKMPEAGREYGARMIPTQIFFDRDDKETYRHEGFMSKADILSKLREAGMKP